MLLQRIFNSNEFAAGGRGGGRRGGGRGMRWSDGGRAWDVLENREIVAEAEAKKPRTA
jgi:hypothetical protein